MTVLLSVVMVQIRGFLLLDVEIELEVFHLLAAEGIFIYSSTTAFVAEMTAAESALSFLHEISS